MCIRDSIRASELTERRLAEARADARALAQTNEKLNATLRDARESLLAVREQLESLGRPPASFAIVVGLPGEDAVDVSASGRLLRVACVPDVSASGLRIGQRVLLNEAHTIVGVADDQPGGELVRVREAIGDLLLVSTGGDEQVLLARASGCLLYTSRCV